MEEDNNDNELGGGGGRRQWRRKNTTTVFNNQRHWGRSVPIKAPQDRHDEDRSRRPCGPNNEDDDDHDNRGLSASESAIGAARVLLLNACRSHGCFHVALRLPTATKTTTTTTATATNRRRRHRPSSSSAATAIDDDDDICHDNIDQRDEDVDNDKCRITSTMMNDEGGVDSIGRRGGWEGAFFCEHRTRWRRPASRVNINDVNDGQAHRIALLVVVPATHDDDRRGYDEDEGGGGDDVGIVPSSRVRRRRIRR